MYSTFWIQQNNNIIWFGKLLVTGRQIVIFKVTLHCQNVTSRLNVASKLFG